MSMPDTVTAGTVSPSSGAVPPGPREGRGVLVLVLVLVNSAAVWGQTGWFLDNATAPEWWPWVALAVAIGLAASLELIGVYCAQMADRSEAKNMPAGGTRFFSYVAGIVSGILNFSHWWHTGAAAALTFGLLSAVSPFLWGIWSRVNRGRPVAPSRRLWHPKRSIKLIRHMAWQGIVDETEAIWDMEAPTGPEPVPVSPAPGMSMADWANEAFTIRENTGKSWEKIATEELGISPSYLYRCRKSVQAPTQNKAEK